mmetsp:Transcript_19498/g.41742  ORF Transcript_19498/g.41742 Transcript_19498/m.41742 type:complete len:230 (-) Transcript_19498:109-798(-)|eukprot:CAMPEP_0172555794 /NCGR_PEP_ID=MMETSP1067-20121228/60287_1 /TAXON_ID=265564 ORGANISM="Thalassiosira punctigera, Strain Tpunct2005C2" /NCGR_SAMPLE_ID=MMETSP1067 /ASSEMBLY_ACC=CAM_ASM_000444 /LENGTH=229 /DNA_ID=CAMNT_0013344391 /DNA_START=30 /DNA_END=719 /DNA_ORIENTATION=+
MKWFYARGLVVSTCCTCLAASFRTLPPTRIKSPVGASSDGSTADDDVSCRIERVNTKARALDVKVFRGFSISASQSVANHESRGTTITEEQAVDKLMVDHDALGNYVMKGNPDYKPTVYFVALNDGPSHIATNGVVGIVSAREIAPGASSSAYIANMKVERSMRRKGIGLGLLDAVHAHYHEGAVNDSGVKMQLRLSVDYDNLPAIALYTRFGFENVDTDDSFQVMALQ